jgi:predicted RNA-binding protein YlxR (DUF448 family)
MASPSELVRVARRPDGSLAVGRHEPGRGAWLCAELQSDVAGLGSPPHAAGVVRSTGVPAAISRACFDSAVRRRALGRALRTDVTEDQVALVRGKLFA